MNQALIGSTGFVGSTLLKQTTFQFLYRSINICDIQNQNFDTIICSGISSQKWLANQDPDEDIKKIDILINCLKTVRCKTFILISTVDVFKNPLEVDEETPVDEFELHPYGLNRRRVEQFVEKNFPKYLIVRLPGLIGPRLRKNIIFDFLNNNNLHMIDSKGVFQFYPMVNLWYDIQIALNANLKLIHLTSEPISVADVSEQGFGRKFLQELSSEPAMYDMRTRHSKFFGKKGLYQYSKYEIIQAIRTYAQSELLTIKH